MTGKGKDKGLMKSTAYCGHVILGAGVSGLSAGYHLVLKGKPSIIFEKNASWGGLCDNFQVDGFRFDYGTHFSFTKNEYVKRLFLTSTDYNVYKPVPYNYFNKLWIKHPAQNNLSPLPIREKIKIIKDFVKRKKQDCLANTNYENWLRTQYGDYFAKTFPLKYTKKYWTLPAKDLEVSWVRDRMNQLSLKEMLLGAIVTKTPGCYYAAEVRYPSKNGFKSFLKSLTEKCSIELNKMAVEIDLRHKKISFEDGTSIHYEHLISSLPLPELVQLIKDVPSTVKEASGNLLCTGIHLVSLGFKRPDIPRYLWFYIYDENILPARVYSPSLKSPDNAPEGCSSLQFEIYFSKQRPLDFPGEYFIRHVIDKSIHMGLFEKNDIMAIDYRKVAYGNVIFQQGIEAKRRIIHDYLEKQGIGPIGRFGEWDYLWSDQSLLSGKKFSEMW